MVNTITSGRMRTNPLFVILSVAKRTKNLSPGLFFGKPDQILQSFYETKFHQLLQNDNGRVVMERWDFNMEKPHYTLKSGLVQECVGQLC